MKIAVVKLGMGTRPQKELLRWEKNNVFVAGIEVRHLCCSACSVPIHLTLFLQRNSRFAPSCLWARHRHRKARTQCQFPTPQLGWIFHYYTCVHKYSVVSYYRYLSFLTEGNNWLTTPNSIKNKSQETWPLRGMYQETSRMVGHEFCQAMNSDRWGWEKDVWLNSPLDSHCTSLI